MNREGADGPRMMLPPSPAPQALAGGAVLIAVGLGIAAGGWLLLPQDPGFPGVVELAQKILLTGFGAAFVLLGLGIAAGRVGAVVDRQRSRLLLEHRILFWRRARALPLDTIRRIEVAGAGDAQGRSPAWLEVHTAGEEKPTLIGLGQTAASLRQLARWIRDWSGLPAEVFAGMEPGERVPLLAPEEIEVRRALERLEQSPWVRVRRGSGRLALELLPLGWRGLALLILGAGAGSTALVLLTWRVNPGIPRPVLLLFGTLPLILLLGAVSTARRRIRLEVRGGMVYVVRSGAFRTTRLEIPAGDVSRLEVSFLGGQRGGSRWSLALVSRAHTPVVTLAHPPLNRRRGTWEDLAVVLRVALAEAAG